MTDLPYFLTVNGIEREIYCDFRDVINIFIAINDEELTDTEKQYIILNNLYACDISELGDLTEAVEKARWFLDWGKDYSRTVETAKIINWEQDFNMVVSAVDRNIKTAESCMELPFLHWWTFLSKFTERGECTLSYVMSIRDKLNKGRKLESYEKEMLSETPEIIEIKTKADEDFEREVFGISG